MSGLGSGIAADAIPGAARVLRRPKLVLMLLLGFAAGQPFLLYFSVLSVRLAEAGVAAPLIGFFSWFGLSYSLKFLWAPLVDRIRPPRLSAVIGNRAAWIVVAQFGVAAGLFGMAFADPAHSLGALALFSFLTAFASATLDIGVDAWRIEAASNDDEQAPLAAVYQYGYRFAMMVAGGAALAIADVSDWTGAYVSMAGLTLLAAGVFFLCSVPGGRPITSSLAAIPAALMLAAALFGIVTVLALAVGTLMPRLIAGGGREIGPGEVGRLAAWLAAAPFLVGAVMIGRIRRLPEGHRLLTNAASGPICDLFRRHGWGALALLAFIASYRLGDIVMGVMAKASYSHIGYDAAAIGLVTGFFGPWPPLIGVALAGFSALRFGLVPTLVAGSVLSILGNLTFVWLMGADTTSTVPLFVAVAADNVAGGFAGTAFVAFLSKLTARHCCASQYALFSSMFTLVPKLIAGTSGLVVEAHGYTNFFLYAAALGVPAVFLSLLASRHASASATKGDPGR